MKARVYDFDPSWDEPDGNDGNDYVLRDVRYIEGGIAFLENGLQSHTFRIVDDEERKICLTCKHKRYGDLAEAECWHPESGKGIIVPSDSCDKWEVEEK